MSKLSELRTEKAQFSILRGKVQNAIGKFNDLKKNFKNLGAAFKEGAIVNGKPFDEGKMDDFAETIGSVVENLQVIYDHCSSKIAELQDAIAAEEARLASIAAAKAAEKENNSNSTNSANSGSKFRVDRLM